MKRLFLTLAVLLALSVLGACLYAETAAKRVVERQSSSAFGTPTSVGLITLGFFDASLRLRGYRVGGPEGFDDTPLFRVAETDLTVGYRGIGRDRIEASRLRVQGVNLNLLVEGGRSNFAPVLQHLRQSTAGAGEASGTPRFVIREVVLEDIAVRVDAPGVQRELKLPPVTLHDVGGEDGVWLSELATLVLGAVMKAAAQHGELPPELAAALGGGLDGLSAELRRTLRDGARERLEEETEGLLDQALEELRGDG